MLLRNPDLHIPIAICVIAYDDVAAVAAVDPLHKPRRAHYPHRSEHRSQFHMLPFERNIRWLSDQFCRIGKSAIGKSRNIYLLPQHIQCLLG